MKKLLLFVFVLLFSHNLFPQVTLLSPNGGEIWLAGSTQNVSWADVNASTGYVNLDYSTDNGVTWNRFASSASSMYPTYSWWLPALVGTTYKVRVTDVNNSFYSDESDAPFSITDKLPSTLTLTYPNGGEIIYSGSPQTITWTSSNVGSVNLYFSADNGMTWNSIASNMPAYMGSYSSIVTSASTNNALIRISDAADAATFDESDGVFTILDTTKHKITLSLPNGGENWQVGTPQYLAWTNTNMTGNVNIAYSTDNGTTWLSVATDLPSMYPTFMWTVPNTPSTTCKIKVYDASDTSVFDESDAVFTIQRLEQFTEQTSISLLGLGLSSVAWGDYNNDGYLDILLTGRNDASHPYTIIYKNNGDGTFTEQTNAALTSASSGSAAWGDYDNDGYLDILLTGYTISGPVSQIYKNNGDGTFTLLSSVSLPGVGNSSVAWGDYDNDGKLDILLTGNSFGARISKIYKNNGNGILTEQTSLSLKGVYNSSVAWGDYDNDGYLDILLTGLSDVSGQVSIIYKNNGDGTFTEQTSVFLAGVEQGSVAWGDYDNDGYLDILLTGINGTNQISKIYKNTGAGTFTEQTSASLTGVSNSSVAWGDYNNDGLLDILLTGLEMNNNPISKIYKNMGEGIFYEQTSASLIGVGNSSVVWGDYDNDGALDILLTGYSIGSGYVSKIYKNINAVFNTASTAPTNLTSSVSGSDVSFNWNKSFDEQTPQNGLSYNLLIGTTLESVDVLSPMANKSNGFRRIVKLGNNQTNSWTIKNLPGGTYLWSVQAIDAAFTGSPFASQEVFTVGEITNTLLILSPNGGENLVTGTIDTIHWSANYLTQVKLDYSTNYGDTWINIVGSMPAEYPSGYAWVVPNTPSTMCKIRVTDINDPTMVDESDNVFTINSGNGFDSISYGGKIYHIVKIGTQTWLKENLDIGSMVSGTQEQTNNSIIEKYCYNNDPIDCETYGGLYQWNEVMDYNLILGTKGICPDGWHVPTNQEFDTLAAFVSYNGNALKALGEGTEIGTGTNESGFTALLAGDFYDYTRIFKDKGSTGNFWTSNSGPFIFYVNSSDAFAGLSDYGAANVNYGFSVRCLKDESPTSSIQIISPNGGEYFVSGTVDTIRWSANSTTPVKIDYTTDNGATWMNIAGGIYSIYPVYTWTVPFTPSTTCKVRVTDNSNPNDFDESDSAFTIQLFKSGEYVPDANTVLLDHFNITTDAAVLAFRETGLPCGSEWPSAAPNFSFSPGLNELNYALNMAPPVGEPQGSTTYLKYPGGQVLSQANGTIEFWIYLPSYEKGLSLVEQGPFFKSCAGWTFNMFIDSTGTLQSSAWAAFGMNSGAHKVPLNRWTHLAVSWGSMGAKMYIDGMWVGSDVNTGMPANGYGGSVLITLGTGAGVSASIDELRVSNIQRTEFNIIPQQTFSLASPNGGENFIAGTVDTIRWTNSYATTLNIDYSIDNGATWTNIYSAMPAGIGSTPWLIPNTPSMSCKVRIVDANNANMFDESDRVFTISTHSFTSLVAYYPFTNASLADSSGNGNHAENFGGQPVADRFGVPGNAFYFDGASYMSAPNSPSLQSPTYMITLAGWIKPDLGSIYAIAVKSITSAMGQYRLYITDNSVVFSSNLIYDVGMSFTFEPGRWYFVAVTWDGNNINYFVNGNFIGSVPSVGTLTPDSEPLVWGMDTPGMTEYTNGTLDDIRIFNRALPTVEIRALYHEGGWDVNNLNNGLVAYYPFNGNANDESGNGNNGTNYGATPTTDRFGNAGKAYSFNGSTSNIQAPANSSLSTDRVSLYCWFKRDGTGTQSPRFVAVGHENTSLQYYSFMVDPDFGNKLRFIATDGVGSGISPVGNSIINVESKWHQAVATFDGVDVKFYLDGVLDKSVSAPWDLTRFSNALIQIGASCIGTDYFHGSLDDIRIYNRVLMQFEIDSLYHEGGWGDTTIIYGNKTYHTVKIGTQTWLKENMDIGSMVSGTQEQTNNSVIEKYCYNDDPVYCETYGGLYQWDEAMQNATMPGTQGICPTGWHVPKQTDLEILANFVGDSSNALKAVGQGTGGGAGTNTSGFSAVLTGNRYTDGSFQNLNSSTYFWSSTENNATYVYGMWLNYYESSIYLDGTGIKNHGFSIRCLKDENITASIQITSPNGGEVYQTNSLVPIEWSATNLYNFSLEFTSDNGASWSLICDTLTSASTGFLWYTPYIESDMVRVRISDKNNPTLFDESDSNFTVTNKITQFIPLYYSGWNMISFYVQPQSQFPRDVFPTPPVLQVKTELQSYDPSLPEFLNTLKSVGASQGYLVKVDSAERSFQITGNHFYPSDGLNYRAGWNLISYYYSYGESVWYAFEPIMTSVEEIKSLTGYFNPLGSTETNTLYSLEPGEAYWLRLKNNIDAYVFPSPGAIMPKKHQTIGQKLLADLPWKLKGYTQSTVTIFTVTSNGEPVSAGSVVAAFVNNECRAISEVKLNSEGTAFATLVINGDKEEEVSFKIFDAVKKEAFGSNLKMKTKPGTTILGIQELPFTFVTGIEDPILPTTTTLMNAYPNPFNPETRIRYELNKDQHVSLKIYDVLGKEVITLVDDTQNAGYYEVSFDASGLPSGIYFYRMQSGEYVSVKKLLLLK